MRRHRRDDPDRRAILVQRHADLARMQVQGRAAAAGRAAVDRIAQNRPAHRGTMDLAASQRFEQEPGQISSPLLTAAYHLPLRDRGLARGVMLHPPAARDIEAAERKIDLPFVGRWLAFDDRPIEFFDSASLEQSAKLRQRLAMPAEHEAAGRVAIEPVRQRRRARQAETQGREMVLEAFAALRPPMHGKTRRFIDHQHQAIAIKEPRYSLFRGHARRRRRSAPRLSLMAFGVTAEPLSQTAPRATAHVAYSRAVAQ